MNKPSNITRQIKEREKRMKWWHEARFGMIVHWGLYSVLGRHEWVMNRERIPVDEYDKLADAFKPKSVPARAWAQLAKKAGMKYMVMTTKHHEGFCLWDTKQTDFNSVVRSPGRDLVAEYVKACREAGLKVGFYYSLMDWHPQNVADRQPILIRHAWHTSPGAVECHTGFPVSIFFFRLYVFFWRAVIFRQQCPVVNDYVWLKATNHGVHLSAFPLLDGF